MIRGDSAQYCLVVKLYNVVMGLLASNVISAVQVRLSSTVIISPLLVPVWCVPSLQSHFSLAMSMPTTPGSTLRPFPMWQGKFAS